jgi:hypothetical protein
VIAYLIGGPQDMVKTLVSDNEFKNRTLTFPHDKVAGLAAHPFEVHSGGFPSLSPRQVRALDELRRAYGTGAYLNTPPGEIENAVYVKVYETHRQGEPYGIYVYSPDGLVP